MQVDHRARTRIGVACALVVLAFVAFWIFGQEVSADPSLEAPPLAEALYPGTWPPVPRGIAWLIAGAAAVGFDLLVMVPRAETRFGRRAAQVLGTITGASFLAFAIGTFFAADWSVIH